MVVTPSHIFKYVVVNELDVEQIQLDARTLTSFLSPLFFKHLGRQLLRLQPEPQAKVTPGPPIAIRPAVSTAAPKLGRFPPGTSFNRRCLSLSRSRDRHLLAAANQAAANGPTAAPQAAKRRKTPMRNSNLLSDCLVDSDVDAAQRNNQRRRKALTISLAVEAVLLAGLLVWPLLSPSTMSARYAIDPIPPFPGGGHQAPQTSSSQPHIIHDHFPPMGFQYQPIGEDSRPPASGMEDEAPSIGGSSGYGNGIGSADGMGILNGTGDGVVPPRPPEPKPAVVTKPIFRSEGLQEAMLI